MKNMPVGIETIKTILGINKRIDLTPSEMAKNLKVTFFPHNNYIDKEIISFGKKLEITFKELGVKIIPYSNALKTPSFKNIFKRVFLFFSIYKRVVGSLNSRESVTDFKKLYCRKFWAFIFGKKIKRGIAIISLGESKEGNLPIDYTTSFKENPIITILQKNDNLNECNSFQEHMEKALNLFTWNMTNLAVCVDKSSWTVYSFNLSYPNFLIDKDFEKNVLNSLITKIAAPVVPPYLTEFIIEKNNFDVSDIKYKPYVDDLVKSGPLLEKTGLYPTGRKIDSLKFKNYFYRWIGAIHLDERNGMSYGFIARQLPTKISKAELLENIKNKDLADKIRNEEIVEHGSKLFVKILVQGRELVIEVPEVWVLTSRSGANKTKLDSKKDIIKMGLKNGQMFLSLPNGFESADDYQPSFDTKVILAHAVSNAIFASVLSYFKTGSSFPKILQNSGFGLAHWHGYIDPKFIPEGWIVYGQSNPSVSCSSPQTAVYAFFGKENGIINKVLENDQDYKGDVHIEPHHGTNMTFSTLSELAIFLLSDNNISKLGNEYLKLYNDSNKLF